ncbi:MAG: mercuric reductase [Chloroflexi bacterium]|nr:mercuric reductase [Chloroflexota bacterium]
MTAAQPGVESIDALVIGSGQGGTPLARELARSGRQTVLVEAANVGGTCVNVGCTPTKTMVASARVADVVRRAAEYGVHVPDGQIEIDLERVHARKEATVQSWRAGSQRSIDNTAGLTLVRGTAHFVGPHAVEVESPNIDPSRRRFESRLVFINTGLRPAVPSLPGLDGIDWLDSTRIMELVHVPEHLIVLGGGYVGLEFGQMFRRFGSRVTLVQRGPRLLPREDPDIADAVAEILRQDGLEVLLETTALHVAGDSHGVQLKVRSADGAERGLDGSHLLVATGRVPNTEQLDLPSAGIQPDAHGFIRTDDRLQTSVPGVYALGDVRGGPAFTHISYDDFRIARANVLEGGNASVRERLVPYTVFIDPQLGRVGLSETEARRQGRNVRVAKLPMDRVARAREVGETRGVMKAVVDAESQQILGCAILGLEGGEIMAVLQVAMMGGLPYTTIKEGVFAHPTLAESLNNLFLTLDS